MYVLSIDVCTESIMGSGKEKQGYQMSVENET